MVRKCANIILVALASIGPAFSQSTAITPRFDLADVHLNREMNPTPEVTGGVLRGGRYELRQANMLDLIATAWRVDTDTVLGGPTWLQIDRFDVIAMAPANTPPEKVRLMLQNLLAERFKLAVHEDMKPLPAFALVAGNSKPKLKESDGSGNGACQSKREQGGVPYLVVSCRNMTMDEFTQNLRGISAPYINRPIVDRSGLKGDWDFDFRFTPWSPTVAQARGDGITIFDALEKQLGLKLEPQKAPAPALVVDHVNRAPTDNPLDVTRDLPPSPMTAFEVAVIKPSAPDRTQNLKLQPGGQVEIQALTLKTLIALAWHLDPDTSEMIAGAPKFLDSAGFDIIARPPAGSGPGNVAPLDVDELRVLLKALLKDRFGLVTHMEDRTVTSYTLVAVKPKMKKADPANPTRWHEGPGLDGKDPRITNPMLSRLVTFQNVTTAQFAELIPWIGSVSYSGPVLDSTGLNGAWDFTLSFSPTGLVQRAGRGGDADANNAISFFDAIEAQLGLKLEKHKRPIPVLVIDHIEETPTDN
jgi:uncharacterized protein (TIGR03435 family)